MWREDVLATAQVDSGTGDNDTQVLSPRPAGRRRCVPVLWSGRSRSVPQRSAPATQKRLTAAGGQQEGQR